MQNLKFVPTSVLQKVFFFVYYFIVFELSGLHGVSLRVAHFLFPGTTDRLHTNSLMSGFLKISAWKVTPSFSLGKSQ